MRKEAHSEKDEVMDSVEDIDFPFTAPPSSINDKQYKEDKTKNDEKVIG